MISQPKNIPGRERERERERERKREREALQKNRQTDLITYRVL